MLESFAEQFPGLDHDPNNFLRRLLYYSTFQDAERETAEARKRCLDFLRKTPPVPKPVAAALIAEIHLSAALKEQGPDDKAGGIYAMFYAVKSDKAAIQKHFAAATKACPGHTRAHQKHIQWLESELKAPRLAKTREKKLEMDLATAMTQFARGCPDEIEPRLWLVDHYLENEKLELAEPHVQWLDGSRNLDLRVRATRWKWHVLEAMRLCRRKTWAPQAKEQLDAAEKIWPAWLSQDWLPYLRAARALRTGDSSTHESVRQQIRDSWTDADARNCRLVDAVATLAAAQRMRVPAADLKPLRKPVDELAREPCVLSLTELLRAGRFFTELFRAGLVYPAYRMHGSKFADELVSRLLHGEVKNDDTKDADFWPAIFWLGYQRSFINHNNPEPHIPKTLKQLDAPERIGAIILQTFLGGRSAWPFDGVHDAMATLTAAVAREKDPYLKFWYASLIEKVGEKIDANPFARNVMRDRLRSVQSQLDEDD